MEATSPSAAGRATPGQRVRIEEPPASEASSMGMGVYRTGGRASSGTFVGAAAPRGALAVTSGSAGYGGASMQLGRPLQHEVRRYVDAMAPRVDRPPLVYSTGNPIDALDRLHEDMVTQYRALSVALCEPARADLTDPLPGMGYSHLYGGASGSALPGVSGYGGGLGGSGVDAAIGLGYGHGYGRGGRAALTLGGHGYSGSSSLGALAAAEPDSLAAARARRGYHSGLGGTYGAPAHVTSLALPGMGLSAGGAGAAGLDGYYSGAAVPLGVEPSGAYLPGAGARRGVGIDQLHDLDYKRMPNTYSDLMAEARGERGWSGRHRPRPASVARGGDQLDRFLADYVSARDDHLSNASHLSLQV